MAKDAKDAFYFSHDSNARGDTKILEMRSVYGSEGYGWYWILIEMMREEQDYKLGMQSKYIWNAYAKQMDCKPEQAKQFVLDCINEFKLFNSDELFFWSNSLNRRMSKREKTSSARSEAARKRWSDAGLDANALQTDANAKPGYALKRKVKESKGKEIKVNIKTPLSFSDDELIPFLEILEYLNTKTGKKFKPVDKTKKAIRARWNEGNRLGEFKTVIDNKVLDWGNPKPGQKDMRQYLAPDTLFGTKFERYLNEQPKGDAHEPGTVSESYSDYERFVIK
jgi:uncharacterized phage protein (TIGR02220 family)